ncbi:MAG: hypothetical protein Q8P41_23650, partial [Pseudomonadota bacterium]|nr:hypothetical protein [Pseudomonadota bacterium]
MIELGLTFAAHLAALAGVPDPQDRSAARLLEAVAHDWAALPMAPTPSFELDGATMWVGGSAVALRPPWRAALAGLEGALRAHGVGGARLVGPVDRGTVVALLRGARALPPSAPREELQRWVLGHGGAALQLLAPRAVLARDGRAALRPVLEAWAAFAAAAESPTATHGADPGL